MVSQPRARLAVFASGGGSNLQAILDHLDQLGAAASAEVVLVVSDRAEAGALERARQRDVAAVHLPNDQSAALLPLLEQHGATMIALAGYLRLVPPDVVAAFHGHLLNVHPALLPAFGGPGMYGQRVHEAVIASRASLTGPTVHFVDERFDEGPNIAQWPVPVLPTDTPDELARRVLTFEHLLYPRVIEAVAARRIRLGSDNRVIYDGVDVTRFTPVDTAADALVQLEAGFPGPLTSDLGPRTSA